MSAYATYLIETLLALVVVAAMSVAILYGARRLGGQRSRGPLSLVGRLPLDARHAIYLVRVGKRVLVVGAGDGGLSRLGVVRGDELEPEPDAPTGSDPTQADAPKPGSLSFNAILDRVRSRKSARTW